MLKQVKGSDVLVLLPHSVDTSAVEAEVLDCVTAVWVLMSVKSFFGSGKLVSVRSNGHIGGQVPPCEGIATRWTEYQKYRSSHIVGNGKPLKASSVNRTEQISK